ncbi:MAG: cytochrome c [Pirellulales bacterium]
MSDLPASAARRSSRRVGGLLVRSLLVAIVIIVGPLWAQTKGGKSVKRAATPKFSASDIKGVYFEDVFDGKVLAGERPANLGAVASGGSKSSGAPASAGDGGAANDNAGSGWSKMVAPTTLEDEIKAIKLQVDKTVTTPTDFAGKGYKESRRNFMMLAMLFGVISEYDGEVRWKQFAPSARELFGRTAANAKVGTQQVYNEAKQRKGDLEELLSGSLSAKTNAEPKVSWGTICDRSPLMQRLEMGLEPHLQPWTASKADFMGKKDELLREAQLFAVMGHVLMQDGMSDADDKEYVAFCEMLKKAALDVADAVKLGNDDAARQAVGRISKSCADCHDKYR